MGDRRWEVVALLWLAYFLHQADKQIYSVVLSPLSRDLGLSGYEAGLVASIFSLVVAVVSPLAGALGDLWPRHRVILWAVAIWSLATAGTAGVSSLAPLLLVRSVLMPAAESFYPPVSHALLAAWHDRTRALAISLHQTAQYAGPIASGYLSGWIAQQAGWRASFAVFGLAGMVLAALMAWRFVPPPASAAPAGSLFAGFRQCWASAAVRRIGLAFAAVLFVTVGYSTWAPTIFARQFGLSLAAAGFHSAAWSSGAAMAGALTGGALSDWLFRRGRPRMELQAIALLAAAPFIWTLGAAGSFLAAAGSLAAAGFFRGIYEGTLAVSLYDHVPPAHRSSAAAVVLLLANLLAAPSSAILGRIADTANLNQAVSALSALFLLASFILWRASRIRPLAGAAE
jgi:MFS family permease